MIDDSTVVLTLLELKKNYIMLVLLLLELKNDNIMTV